MIDALIGAFYVWVAGKIFRFLRFVMWLARLTKAQFWYFLAHVHVVLSDAVIDLIENGAIERESWIARGIRRLEKFSYGHLHRKFEEIRAERDTAKRLLPKPSGD